jgi:hypothetical protein
MKKLIMIFVVGLLIQQVAQAQGTVYVSNLGQTITGVNSAGNNSWLAEMFFTGNNPGGYTIELYTPTIAPAVPKKK